MMVSDSLFEQPDAMDFSREALLASQPERRMAAGLALIATPLALLAALVLVVKMPAVGRAAELPATRLAARQETPAPASSPALPVLVPSVPVPVVRAPVPVLRAPVPAPAVEAPRPLEPAPRTIAAAPPLAHPASPKRGTRHVKRSSTHAAPAIEIWPSEAEPAAAARPPPAAPEPAEELKRPAFD